MSLTRQDVEKIAHLARLSITEQEMPVYVTSLSSIVNFVDELSRARDRRRRAHGASARWPASAPARRRGDRRATITRNTRRNAPACKRRPVRRAASDRVGRIVGLLFLTTMLHNLSIGELADRLGKQADFER